jgi:L-asparaginase
MTEQNLPRVAVIGTGGTISYVGRDNLDLVNYAALDKRHNTAELIAAFPEVHSVAQIDAIPFQAVPSTAMGVPEWLKLVKIISELDSGSVNYDGIVVTHGTASLEETAYFLNLTLKTSLPVVVVGSQRPSSAFCTDAGMNLLNGIRVAGSTEARGLGVLVLLNDEIQAAREVTKTSTYRMQTFRTPDFGVLGHADGDGTVAIYRRPTRCHAPDTEFDVSGLSELPRVDILLSHAGADGVAVDAYIQAGAKGIIAAGMAPGFGTQAEVAALERAQEKGILIVQSSRAGSGRVMPGDTLRVGNAISADNLNPQKARVLMMLALSKTADPKEIDRMFKTY